MTRSARIRRRVGVSLMVATMGMGASVLVLAPAGAQAPADAEIVQLEVIRTAYYTGGAGQGAPNTATNEFPPGVACIVRPEVCPDDLREPLFDPIGGQLQEVENLPTAPTETTAPGTLPAGVMNGETHYQTAILTSLPEVPAGQEVSTFVLRLLEDPSQTFHTSSPMFRQAILTALASYQSGGLNQDEFMKALASDPVDLQVTGVEACPIITEFTAGPNQAVDAAPEIECLFGGNGNRLEDGTWEFDLTFAAEAWADGSLPNLGIFLRPAAAPNLAYGDKDFTSSARVVFVTETAPEAAVVYQPERQAPAPFTPPASEPLNASPAFTPSFSPPVSSGIAAPSIISPQVAEEPAPDVATETVAAPFIPGVLDTPSAWWIWLLVPIFLMGMYLTAQSLATDVVLVGGGREGAMSRLIANNGTIGGVGVVASSPRQGAMSRLVSKH